jgi:hypothetical protein
MLRKGLKAAMASVFKPVMATMTMSDEQRRVEWLGQDQREPLLEAFVALRDVIDQTPSARFVSSKMNRDGTWWVQLRLNHSHHLVWHVIQRYGYVLNSITMINPLPTMFAPRSLPPVNGGPDDMLLWRISGYSAEFKPDDAAYSLQLGLPASFASEAAWLKETETP